MSKDLVAFFSAGGTTKAVAERLAGAIGADLFEIEPKVPYTKADLNWMDSNSRTTLEMNGKKAAEIKDNAPDVSGYDRIFVGFPIWWYIAPPVINAFLEKLDLNGKVVVPFATSGSSQMGGTNAALAPSCRGAILKEGKRFSSRASDAELKAFAEQF